MAEPVSDLPFERYKAASLEHIAAIARYRCLGSDSENAQARSVRAVLLAEMRATSAALESERRRYLSGS
jgi:hypothetical protein